MPRTSAIAGDRTRPSKQPIKRKLQAAKSESSTPASTATRSRTERSVTGEWKGDPSNPRRQSDEPLVARSRKRPRTGPQRPRATSAGKKEKTEIRPHTTRLQSAKSKISSSRLSNNLTDDRRSATLSAEPPPVTRSTVSPTRDPDFELKRCAREQFRESGDFGVFNTLLAPFRKGEKKRELSDWAYDKEKLRWRREDKSNGLIIWAPTPDSFL